jgi:hypothetical protein
LRIIGLDDHVANELTRVTFDAQRRWLPRIAGALAVLTVLALLLALVGFLPPWLAALFGTLALALGGAIAYYEWSYRRHNVLRAQLRAGLRGQRLLPRILSNLDDDYYLINNLELPGRADDIDHIVVGPNGIFALETKNHRGRIYWRDGQWYQAKMSRSGRPQPEMEIRDPVQQLKRNVDYLRSCINYTNRTLSRRTALWIEGVVVFTHPAVSLDLPEEVVTSLPFPVLRARDLPAHLLGHIPRRRHNKAEVRQIVGLLAHLEPPPPRAP